MQPRRDIVGMLAGATALAAGAPAGLPAATYDLTDLGALGGSTSQAMGISESGLVAGYARDIAGGKHAARWDRATITDLGVPSGFGGSSAEAVNDSGQVAANGEGSPQSYGAYRWENGTWTPLGVLPGRSESLAEDIDSAGRIVGRSFTLGAGDGGAFLWDGTMMDLGTLGGTAAAYGMNDAGQIVGRSQEILPDSTTAPRAFLWEDGVMTSLGVLPGEDYSQAFNVNQAGDAVGSSWHVTSFLSADQAVLWLAGGAGIVDLGLTPGPPVCIFGFPFYTKNIARALNDRGQVVGEAMCLASGGALAAFLWEDGVMSNLNDLVAPGTGWNLLSAQDINDAGEIVGLGIEPGGQLHGFLLTPTAPVAAHLPARPPAPELGVAPSPFRGEATVSFDLPAATQVRLTVHDVAGRRVALLVDGVRGSGPHAVTWSARGGSGRPLPAGMYFLRLVAGGEVVTRKVVRRR